MAASGKPVGAGLEGLPTPELVVGLVAPVGAELDRVEEALAAVLARYPYEAIPVKLTDELATLSLESLSEETRRLDQIRAKMDAGNELRRRTRHADAMACLGVMAIRRERESLNPESLSEGSGVDFDGSKAPRPRTAYVVRQLKRPEEVETLRLVYGDAFVLIGAHEPRRDRERRLAERNAQDCGRRHEGEDDQAARKLIDRDQDESASPFGQRLSETYHLADAIVDAGTPEAAESQLGRVFDAFFDKPFTTPTRAEYFLNLARQVALRSADLSRQVGAVIVGDDDAILGVGCNDVPKPGGGCYWEGDPSDSRDFRLGYDPSVKQKQAILGDALERLGHAKWLADDRTSSAIERPADLVVAVTAKAREDAAGGPLAGAHVTDLLEFGRVVHAEMNALAEAARAGRAVAGATLYCTTFPCHMCARHIVAAGIRRVIYLEPYPKSLAFELHGDAIVEAGREGDPAGRVVFEAFIGVAPPLFERLFARGKRKTADGDIESWHPVQAKPRLEILYPTHVHIEDAVVAKFYESLIAADLLPDLPAPAS